MKTIAIIGGGPRGLSALESLVGNLTKKNLLSNVNLILFEETASLGAGSIYATGQPDTNWLNVSERGLTIPVRAEITTKVITIPRFPSFHEWAGYDCSLDNDLNIDQFPLRSTLGQYLTDRFKSIARPLIAKKVLTVINSKVLSTLWERNKFEIKTCQHKSYTANEVALTIGHQPTRLSDEIDNWGSITKSKSGISMVEYPYPVTNINKLNELDAKAGVALRGFGLATIDVIRALTQGRGGSFKITDVSTQAMTYIPSGKEPKKIIPYSLDGLPMAPKPVNLKIDKLFFPTDQEKQDLQSMLSKAAQNGTAHDLVFLIEGISQLVSRIYLDLGDKALPTSLSLQQLSNIVAKWLTEDKFEDDLFISQENAAEQILTSFVDMASGQTKFSLDYCIGNVWRHCQPILYKAFSFSNIDDEVMTSIIQLDERMKRYAYGPPVASLQQLVALIKHGILTLDFANNPEIKLCDDGWHISTVHEEVIAKVMVNTVLDPPAVAIVNSDIVKTLRSESYIEKVHESLGVNTHQDGIVIPPNTSQEIPLAILGRLAKGTLLGVDAILECFNERSNYWADGVIKRI